MESRYALRELESVIGYDCRRLEDGRKAVFRHTGLHRRARRDYYERLDMKAAMQANLFAFGTRSMSLATVEERRMDLLGVLFPYISFEAPKVQVESIDDLFDELDAIIARQEQQKAMETQTDGDSSSKDGIIDGKVTEATSE